MILYVVDEVGVNNITQVFDGQRVGIARTKLDTTHPFLQGI